MSEIQNLSSRTHFGNTIGVCARKVDSDNILIAQEMFHGLRTNKACQGKYMEIKTDMSKACDRVE